MRHVFRAQAVPSLWFDQSLNYSRSVATTSIVGYILGIGDRHVSNILMDKKRGDLVIIDLGIAFDQVRPPINPRDAYGLPGTTSTDPRNGTLPTHPEHRRRPGHARRRRCVPSLCRGDAPCAPRRLGRRHDRSRGVQARSASVLVRLFSILETVLTRAF